MTLNKHSDFRYRTPTIHARCSVVTIISFLSTNKKTTLPIALRIQCVSLCEKKNNYFGT